MIGARAIDIAVLVGYLVAVVGWGCWFGRRSKSAEQFMDAGRSLPGWAIGLSIFGSYVSSISFLANPGKAFAEDWNVFVFALSLPFAAWIAVRWFVPFFRRSGEVSAYHHLESRFGAWARTYGVVGYMLTQLARLGTILYLLALALAPLIHLDVATIIVLSGIVVTVYPFFGGSEGVIWTGVVQSLVLVLGAVACVAFLVWGMPGGPREVVEVGEAAGKFSLGSTAYNWALPTFWVTFLYGITINLQNFGIDQSYVQRYITARSDGDASRSVWMGALCYIPLSAVFLFIGTALYVFYRLHTDLLPRDIKSDAVFPLFIATQLPPGLVGLVLAAICSAAMDSNLNCCATLYLCDIHRRYLRPAAGETESMWVLRITTLVMGALSTGTALAMMSVKSALDAWWGLAGILSGGILGLFLLGLINRRANQLAGFVATLAGLLVILWITLSPKLTFIPVMLRSPFHNLWAVVFGTSTIVISGYILSCFPIFQRPNDSVGNDRP